MSEEVKFQKSRSDLAFSQSLMDQMRAQQSPQMTTQPQAQMAPEEPIEQEEPEEEETEGNEDGAVATMTEVLVDKVEDLSAEKQELKDKE